MSLRKLVLTGTVALAAVGTIGATASADGASPSNVKPHFSDVSAHAVVTRSAAPAPAPLSGTSGASGSVTKPTRTISGVRLKMIAFQALNCTAGVDEVATSAAGTSGSSGTATAATSGLQVLTAPVQVPCAGVSDLAVGGTVSGRLVVVLNASGTAGTATRDVKVDGIPDSLLRRGGHQDGRGNRGAGQLSGSSGSLSGVSGSVVPLKGLPAGKKGGRRGGGDN